MAKELEPTEKAPGVNRRDLLKVMGTAPAAVLVTVTPGMAEGRQPAHPHPAVHAAAAHPGAHMVLTPHEFKTVSVLSDLIIPADGHSGSATQAQVPTDMDSWLHMQGGNLLAEIRGGLTWLDLESNRLHQRDFVDSTVAQQKALLDRIAYPGKSAPDDRNATAFFTSFRNLVVSAFFSSKLGVADLKYMGNTVVTEWNGCPADALAHLGVSYDESKA